MKLKVIATKTCYTSDNKRKRADQVFNVKKEEFSFNGMGLHMGKGKHPKTFANMKELDEYLAKPEKEKEEPEELEIIDEADMEDESYDEVSNQEVI